MWRQRRMRIRFRWLAIVGILLATAPAVVAQSILTQKRGLPLQPAPAATRSTEVEPPPNVSRAEADLLQALAANPVTAPYPFATSLRGGKVVLQGTVGTKVVHDAAIRTAIALGINVDDELLIDTAAAHVAASAPLAGAAPPMARPGMVPSATYSYGYPPYIYPQPLFGWYDEPFYGFEPPVISYPPWWGALSAHRLDPRFNGMAAPPVTAAPPVVGESVEVPIPSGMDGAVEMTIDPRGFAVLRGTVPTLEDRVAIGQRLARLPGIAGVQNELKVQVPPEDADVPSDAEEQVPAAPQPDLPPGPGNAAEAPKEAAEAIQFGGEDAAVGDRLQRALDGRAALKGLPIRVTIEDGVATLTGKVPTVYEAMITFRATEQTPGVRRIVDRLEFTVPEIGGPNPLIEKGNPEDVEPYLEAQIQRQLGTQAHVDRVRLNAGDRLVIRGTIATEEDRARVGAILRSMPILRGFQLDSEFFSQ